MFRVKDDANSEALEPFLEIPNRLIYSIEFHPGYRTNGYFFAFSNGQTSSSERTNRILEQMDRTKMRFIQVSAHELDRKSTRLNSSHRT